MKKAVIFLGLFCIILTALLVVVLLRSGNALSIPNLALPKITPAPTNTMLNELNEEGIGKETSNSKAIQADGVMLGGIKQGIIEASNFKFEPDAISVNEGDTVAITIKNTQGIHDFVIDELNVKSKTLKEGESEEITFVASKKGTFQFYSSVGQHRVMGMVGTIVVN